MRFRDVLYLVNASLRCLLHIVAIIFMRDSFYYIPTARWLSDYRSAGTSLPQRGYIITA